MLTPAIYRTTIAHSREFVAQDYFVLPPADSPVLVTKEFSTSRCDPVHGRYLVLAPRPGREVDIMVSLHRDHQPAFVAPMRGLRQGPTARQIALLQLVAPLAQLTMALRVPAQGIALSLSRIPTAER